MLVTKKIGFFTFLLRTPSNANLVKGNGRPARTNLKGQIFSQMDGRTEVSKAEDFYKVYDHTLLNPFNKINR